MRGKKTKRLRQVVKDLELPDREYLRNTQSGQVRLGDCKRAVYQFFKRRVPNNVQDS